MIPNIIILEGCDKTGKSTLAKEIAAKGYEIMHLGVPKAKQDYYDKLLKILTHYKHSGKKVVFDRFHWGDYVYEGITTTKRFLSKAQHENLDNLLYTMGAIMIYCELPLSKIKEGFIKDSEELIDSKHIEPILCRYEELLQTTVLPVYFHDFSSNPLPII